MSEPTCKSDYCVRKASLIEEIQAAQRLRYEVFNVELGEGLASSMKDKRDEDPFDAYCEHLIVEYRPSQEIIGTYRLQTGQMAAEGIGYYSAQEFDLTPYEDYRHETLELGRACIHSDHRKRRVLELLWRGIIEYAIMQKSRYLIGCSSLTSQDPDQGWGLYHQLNPKYMAASNLQTRPLAGCQLDPASDTLPKVKCPKLFTTYLHLGAKIAGPPAIDREFKTIDFFTVFDFKKMRKTGVLDFVKKDD